MDHDEDYVPPHAELLILVDNFLEAKANTLAIDLATAQLKEIKVSEPAQLQGYANHYLNAAVNHNLPALGQVAVDYGANPDCAPPPYLKFLMTAALNGQTEMCGVLVRAGADVNENCLSNGHGATAVDLAIKTGHMTTAALLINHGGVPCCPDAAIAAIESYDGRPAPGFNSLAQMKEIMVKRIERNLRKINTSKHEY